MQIHLNCTYVTGQFFSKIPGKEEKGSSPVEMTSVSLAPGADSPTVRGFQCPNCTNQGKLFCFLWGKGAEGFGGVW